MRWLRPGLLFQLVWLMLFFRFVDDCKDDLIVLCSSLGGLKQVLQCMCVGSEAVKQYSEALSHICRNEGVIFSLGAYSTLGGRGFRTCILQLWDLTSAAATCGNVCECALHISRLRISNPSRFYIQYHCPESQIIQRLPFLCP